VLALFPAVLLALLGGAAMAAPPRAIPCEAGIRRIELKVEPTGELPEFCISPRLSTTFLFLGGELLPGGVSVEGREQFSLVDPGSTTLRLLPSERVAPGARFQLTVRFKDGAAPASAAFWLVVYPGQVEPLVEVYREKRTVESYQQEVREKDSQFRQCQEDYTRLQAEHQGPRGLAGLLATGLMDPNGVAPKDVMESVRELPGNILRVRTLNSYRSARVVAVEVELIPIKGMDPWRIARAELEGPGRHRPRVSTLWQREPLWEGATDRRVVLEAEATKEESRGSFTLKLSNEDGTRTVTLSGVTFP